MLSFGSGVTFNAHTLLYGFVSALVGCQLVAFAVFTKALAISEGLLPLDPRLDCAFRYITLEPGLVIGSLLVTFELRGSIFAVSG